MCQCDEIQQDSKAFVVSYRCHLLALGFVQIYRNFGNPPDPRQTFFGTLFCYQNSEMPGFVSGTFSTCLVRESQILEEFW
jgi:hypothetical protein